jgi:hypothetical protein
MNEKAMRGHFVQTDARQGLTLANATRVAELLAAQRAARAQRGESESLLPAAQQGAPT